MWTRAAALSLALASGPAHAARTSIALSGGGGYDFLTRQPWAGLDLSFWPEQEHGFSFVGRLRGAYAATDQRPFGVFQGGFMGVLPAATIIPRLGVLAHLQVNVTQYPLPIQLGAAPTGEGWGSAGLLPGGMLAAEVGFQRPDATKGPAVWSFGLHAGAALGVAAIDCAPGTPAEIVCYSSSAMFIGGVAARMRFHEGVWLEAVLGPSAHVSIGYAWGVGGRRKRP